MKTELDDLDIGHVDNEPHYIKSQLYHIANYATELYKMVCNLDNGQEIDFPAWWQSKITNAAALLDGAKHYLEFENHGINRDESLFENEDLPPSRDSVIRKNKKVIKEKSQNSNLTPTQKRLVDKIMLKYSQLNK
jgi:hypothetical protein